MRGRTNISKKSGISLNAKIKSFTVGEDGINPGDFVEYKYNINQSTVLRGNAGGIINITKCNNELYIGIINNSLMLYKYFSGSLTLLDSYDRISVNYIYKMKNNKFILLSNENAMSFIEIRNNSIVEIKTYDSIICEESTQETLTSSYKMGYINENKICFFRVVKKSNYNFALKYYVYSISSFEVELNILNDGEIQLDYSESTLPSVNWIKVYGNNIFVEYSSYSPNAAYIVKNGFANEDNTIIKDSETSWNYYNANQFVTSDGKYLLARASGTYGSFSILDLSSGNERTYYVYEFLDEETTSTRRIGYFTDVNDNNEFYIFETTSKSGVSSGLNVRKCKIIAGTVQGISDMSVIDVSNYGGLNGIIQEDGDAMLMYINEEGKNTMGISVTQSDEEIISGVKTDLVIRCTGKHQTLGVAKTKGDIGNKIDVYVPNIL